MFDHVGLRVKDMEIARRFYRARLNAGARDNGKPGLRADYGPAYFAAFLIDPDGNNIEAVCWSAG